MIIVTHEAFMKYDCNDNSYSTSHHKKAKSGLEFHIGIDPKDLEKVKEPLKTVLREHMITAFEFYDAPPGKALCVHINQKQENNPQQLINLAQAIEDVLTKHNSQPQKKIPGNRIIPNSRVGYRYSHSSEMLKLNGDVAYNEDGKPMFVQSKKSTDEAIVEYGQKAYNPDQDRYDKLATAVVIKQNPANRQKQLSTIQGKQQQAIKQKVLNQYKLFLKLPKIPQAEANVYYQQSIEYLNQAKHYLELLRQACTELVNKDNDGVDIPKSQLLCADAHKDNGKTLWLPISEAAKLPEVTWENHGLAPKVGQAKELFDCLGDLEQQCYQLSFELKASGQLLENNLNKFNRNGKLSSDTRATLLKTLKSTHIDPKIKQHQKQLDELCKKFGDALKKVKPRQQGVFNNVWNSATTVFTWFRSQSNSQEPDDANEQSDPSVEMQQYRA